MARDAARLVLERHCGDCHVPDSPLALPRALAVYNLRELEWAQPMKEGQLSQLAGRLASGPMFDPSDSRNAGKLAPPGASAEEIAAVSRFVTLELARRHAQAADTAAGGPAGITRP